MISKEEAIVLLDQYLELEYNVDSLFANRKANRPSITENDYCWKIYACPEEELDKKTFNGGIGAGPYYIDKVSSNIFATSSAPHIQFEEDYIYFKQHGQSLLDWFPLKSVYLDATVKTQTANNFKPFQLKAKYVTRAIETKEYLLQQFKEVSDDFSSLEIRYKPIDGIDCLVLVNIVHDEIRKASAQGNARKVQSISLPFTGGFDQFTKTLMDLKKWIRVNHKNLSNDAWIEVVEKDWVKDFNDWGLIAHLTFKG